jgi:co-chaperonin GroES (HSP10)
MYSENALIKDIDLDRLPTPQGYKILIACPKVEEKTAGGLYIPEKRRAEEEIASIVGLVVRKGPEAYSDKSRTNYSWCQEGDWVIFRSYSGTRFMIDDVEFRLINDDTVEAVVTDPHGYKRV